MVITALGRYRCFTDISSSLHLHERIKDLGNLRDMGIGSSAFTALFFHLFFFHPMWTEHIALAHTMQRIPQQSIVFDIALGCADVSEISGGKPLNNVFQ